MTAFIKIKSKLIRANLENRVHLIGHCEKIAELMHCADGFLFASENEGFGNVIIEAMATGLPVVIQELPGITDFIFSNPDTGIVVPIGDNDALADKVIRIIKDPDFGKLIGKRARQEVINRFSLEDEAKSHAMLYHNIMRNSRGINKTGKYN